MLRDQRCMRYLLEILKGFLSPHKCMCQTLRMAISWSNCDSPNPSERQWQTRAESDIECFYGADWARDLPEAAHGEVPGDVVTAPTPAHMYCIRLLKQKRMLVRMLITVASSISQSQ